jgi:hypothetical protein
MEQTSLRAEFSQFKAPDSPRQRKVQSQSQFLTLFGRHLLPLLQKPCLLNSVALHHWAQRPGGDYLG